MITQRISFDFVSTKEGMPDEKRSILSLILIFLLSLVLQNVKRERNENHDHGIFLVGLRLQTN